MPDDVRRIRPDRKRNRPGRFLTINMMLAIVIAGLGIAQSIIGVKFLNPAILAPDLKELASLHRVAPISGAIVYRATSVFVSDARFATYLVMIWCLVLGATGYQFLRGQTKGRLFCFLPAAWWPSRHS